MYTLYYAPGAASLCVHLALIEIGADYVLQRVDLDAGQQREPAYLVLNPNGVVPTLVLDGVPHTEAAALLMWLADRHPDAGLAPAAADRAAWYQWLVYLTNTVQPMLRLWWYPGDIPSMTAAQVSAIEQTVKAAVASKLERAWQRVDTHLLAHGPYLLGAGFSAADIFLTMLMRWSRHTPRPPTEWAALRSLAERIKSRPSWKQLYALEGLTEWA
jgi:glutathione S-transferase